MTRVGILGTGMVGRTLAGRLVELGHEVRMGARRVDNEAARQWATAAGELASTGDFADAAKFGEIVVNATAGGRSLAALAQAGAQPLGGKVLLDIANPLQPAPDGATALSVANTDSLAEQIQRAYPDTSVVKALNTMNCEVMVRPGLVPGPHVALVCGDRAEAKAAVAGLLEEFGWPADRIIDLGGITAARGTEAFLLLWLPLRQALGRPDFNIAIARGTG